MKNQLSLSVLFFFGCLMYIFVDLGKTLSDPNRNKLYCEGVVYPDGPFGRSERFSGWYTKEQIDNPRENMVVSFTCGGKP